MTVQTETRNATLDDLARLLSDQHAAKVDVVAPATTIRSKQGLIHVKGAESLLTDDGVTTVDGVYRPTAIFDEGVAEKLGVPLAYVRRMRAERVDLYDANVNGWLHGKTVTRLGESSTDDSGTSSPGFYSETIAAPDARSFLFRGYTGTEDSPGVARALLSNSYGVNDHLDVLTAAMQGVRDAGVDVDVQACDLTDRRMYVRIAAPSVAALAPALLAGYRSPFRDENLNALRGGDPVNFGYGPVDEPLVFAGLVISNSEVGAGAFSIAPRLIVKVCTNGMIMTADAIRAVHLGSKLADGLIVWSADTMSKNLAVVTAKARDAVATFLSAEYVNAAIAKLTETAGTPLADSERTIEHVSKKLAFSEQQTRGILDHFIRGGQVTSGGVMQAVTSFAQTVTDADAAHDLESRAVQAMELAHAFAR